MPSVTRLTDMNEYENASNPDQPLTRPVAFLRNSDGAVPVPDAMTFLLSTRTSPVERAFSRRRPNERPMRRALAVDQQIALHRSLLLIEVDDGCLEDAILV